MDQSFLSDKIEALYAAEEALNEEIRLAHEVTDEDEEVMLNWDEQRDLEYLYDRIDLFAALHSLVCEDTIDDTTKARMLDVLTADIKDVIDERLADIEKANAVIADMRELLQMCEREKGTM